MCIRDRPYLLFAVAMVPIIVSIAGGVDNVTPEGNAQIRFFVLLFVLVFFGWAGLARLIRGEVLSLKQREFVDAGGLVSYGSNVAALFRRAASYVDRILKGAKPGDLAVEQAAKFELVVNLRTARELGLTVPAAVLLRADDVVQ